MKQHKTDKAEETFLLCLLIFIIISIIITAPFMPDERLGIIKREMQKNGYDIENVSFEIIREESNRWQWVFESSEPIYHDGYYVSKWIVTTHHRRFPLPFNHYYYRVRPYATNGNTS